MAEYRVPNVNIVLISGHLTAEPDLKYTPDGKAICKFAVASSRRYKDKTTGEWVEAPPTFVRVVVFGQVAERLGETLHKGSAVFVEGRLQSRSWTTPDNEKKSILEINASRAQNLTKQTTFNESEGTVKENAEEEAKQEDGEGKEGLPF